MSTGSSVDPAPSGAYFAFSGIVLLGLGLARGRSLLGILQRKLKLFLGQALGSRRSGIGPFSNFTSTI
jgi:hypothetical protein